jgi:membrane-anchored glycerophosphoryl diester phosphodiesterase (GDPDase)
MGIVFFLLIFLSALLLIALSVFLTVCFLFVVPAVVLEGQNPIDALRRSWELALSSFWRVLGIYLLLTLLVFVLTLVPAGALSFVIGIVFSDPSEIIIQQSLSNLVSYSMQILVLPLSVIGITVLYYDLRVRKEGEDLQMMAQSYELPNTP